MSATIKIPMPLIESVVPIKDFVVRVQWKKSQRPNTIEDIDLSPMISLFKFYRQLRSTKALLKTVHVIEFGNAIAWGKNDEIDMSATSVEELADEAISANDFKGFLAHNSLTQDQAALVLGRSRRQIAYYVSGRQPIPRIVALACYGYSARVQRAKLGFPLRGGTYGRIGTKPITGTQGNLQISGKVLIEAA